MPSMKASIGNPRTISLDDACILLSTETTGKEINKYTSMPFSMALKSSFKNILTKKIDVIFS